MSLFHPTNLQNNGYVCENQATISYRNILTEIDRCFLLRLTFSAKEPSTIQVSLLTARFQRR